VHNQTLLEIFILRSSQQLVSTNLLRISSCRDATFVRRHIIFDAESQNGHMTEWSFWADTAVKKYCSVFPFKVACAWRHFYFRFARGNRRSFSLMDHLRGLQPRDVTVTAHWARLFTALRFGDSATWVLLPEASVFALQADGRAVTKLVLGYQSLDVREPLLIFT